jgi:hypothetical protein
MDLFIDHGQGKDNKFKDFVKIKIELEMIPKIGPGKRRAFIDRFKFSKGEDLSGSENGVTGGKLENPPPVVSLPDQIPVSNLHCVKSISCLHPLHTCFFSNSSEKISVSLPQLGHLQEKDFRFLNCSYPGQCCGVVIMASFGLKMPLVVWCFRLGGFDKTLFNPSWRSD